MGAARDAPPERLLSRSWDEKQRERSRLARLAMLERDNHHTDNTHMMKVQNLADDEVVGGGVLARLLTVTNSARAHPALTPAHVSVRRFLCAGTWTPKRWLHSTTAAPMQ